jgi:hypothetical protein
MTKDRQLNPYRVQSAECRVQSAECRVQSYVNKIPNGGREAISSMIPVVSLLLS